MAARCGRSPRALPARSPSLAPVRGTSSTAAGSAPAVEPILLGLRLCPAGARHADERQVLEVCAGGHGVKVCDPSLGNRVEELVVDAVMDSRNPESPDYVGQEGVYERFGRPMVDHIFQGDSSALFAYGQSGTGKTTTIIGEAELNGQGLLPRALEDIFERASQRNPGRVRVHMQMLEIYNEKIRDLLTARAPAFQSGADDLINRAPAVHAHPQHGVYVTGAEEPLVESLAEAMALLTRGLSSRSVAPTALNQKSSRAHTVIKLRVQQTSEIGTPAEQGSAGAADASAELFFVDLAGRENEKTSKVTGDRRKELICINRSLFHLSSCIKGLGSSAQASPAFRNSCLTLLLRNALTGRSRTAMIGTLHPAASHCEESLNTLRFAAIVKGIKLLRTANHVTPIGVGKPCATSKWRDAARLASRARSPEQRVHAAGAKELQRKQELSALDQKLKEQQRLREEQSAEEARVADKCERLAAEARAHQEELDRQKEELRLLEARREEAAHERCQEEQRLQQERQAEETRAVQERAKLAAEVSAQHAEIERKKEALRGLEAQVASAAKKSLEDGRRLREQQQAEIAKAAEERARLEAEARATKAELDRQSEETRRLETERMKALKDMLDEEQRLREEQHTVLARAAEERKRFAEESAAEQAELSRRKEELKAVEAERAQEQAILEQQRLERERISQERAALSAERAEVDRRLLEIRSLEAKREEAARVEEQSRHHERAVRACVRAKKKLEQEMRQQKERMLSRQSAYVGSPAGSMVCSPAAMSPLELLVARETLIHEAARGGRAETVSYVSGGTTTTFGSPTLAALATSGWSTERGASTYGYYLSSTKSGCGDQTARLGDGFRSIADNFAKNAFINNFQFFPEARELPFANSDAVFSEQNTANPLVQDLATCGGA